MVRPTSPIAKHADRLKSADDLQRQTKSSGIVLSLIAGVLTLLLNPRLPPEFFLAAQGAHRAR